MQRIALTTTILVTFLSVIERTHSQPILFIPTADYRRWATAGARLAFDDDDFVRMFHPLHTTPFDSLMWKLETEDGARRVVRKRSSRSIRAFDIDVSGALYI
ncbi:hypothetical protein AAVH_14953 [Aphelenchoides avenae]|nr:hypothetical protein AAVH_14953 [Aphelenchus avenae]